MEGYKFEDPFYLVLFVVLLDVEPKVGMFDMMPLGVVMFVANLDYRNSLVVDWLDFGLMVVVVAKALDVWIVDIGDQLYCVVIIDLIFDLLGDWLGYFDSLSYFEH